MGNVFKLRGVNLGGWLVLERWMTPGVFKGTNAKDEHGLATALGNKKSQVFKQHRNTFITEQDIKWISRNGFNAVRLPVGYWLFGDQDPYIASDKYVDKLFTWAKRYKLKVILDLHSAPGSQNGLIHSGQTGEPKWHTDPDNIKRTIEILSKMSECWGKHPNLYGIELLNEPHKEIALSILQKFYMKAYKAVRKHCKDSVVVIMSDAYRPLAEWDEFMKKHTFKNVLLDMHLYQVFMENEKNMSLSEHIDKAMKWKKRLNDFGSHRILVGEWSIVISNVYNEFNSEDAKLARSIYMQTHHLAFSQTAGWFYWNYKTENPTDDWNLRSLMAN